MRDTLTPDATFSYADEVNLSWRSTVRAMWSPQGQQVMLPTPAQPKQWYSLGAVNYHTGETLVHSRRRKRRLETAAVLQALRDRHPTGTGYVAGDNARTHVDDDVEAVVRAAAGRLVLFYVPPASPWRNPIEMLWRHFRREGTDGERFETMAALGTAAYDFFTRHNGTPERGLLSIGAYPTCLVWLDFGL